MPVGGDLEYADEVTLIRALQGRRARSLSVSRAMSYLSRDPAAPDQGRSRRRPRALVYWLIAVGPLGAPGSVELALLCWLSGAAFILLVEESPI